MSELVLDASVALAWCFPDESEAYADAVMVYLRDHTAAVPALWFFEIANAIIVAERRGRIRRQEIARVLELISSVTINVDLNFSVGSSVATLVSFARQTRLSAYDATYLDLAIRLGLPLATTDRALRRAAANSDVPPFSPPS